MKKILFIILWIILIIALFFACLEFQIDHKIRHYFAEKKIEKANYCVTKDDCALVWSKCPFGCYVYVNKTKKEEIKNLINNFHDSCLYNCKENHKVECVKNKCEISYFKKEKPKLEDIKKYIEKEYYKENDIMVHFDYPIIKNSKIHEEIKNWWENIIKEKKAKFKTEFHNKDWELHFDFEIYKSDLITSIVYKVREEIWLAHPNKYSKVFYISKSNKKIDKPLLLEEKQKNIKDKIIERLKEKNIRYFKEDIDKNLEKYLKNPKIYFENKKVYFIFDPYEIAPYSEWTIKLDFEYNGFESFLNPLVFPPSKAPVIEKKEKNSPKNSSLEEKKTLSSDPSNTKEKKQIPKKSPTLEEKKTPSSNPSFKKDLNKKENKSNNSKSKNLIKSKKADSWPKYVALTFDDWPSKKLTPKLLRILKKHNIKATFFVLWKNVSYFPEILKQTKKEGHEIWNHSWSHPNLKKVKDDRLKEEIEKTDREIEKAIWERPKFFRPPYWAFDNRVKKAIWRTILMWNVDSRDWKNKNIEKNIESVEKDLKNGSIILFHDIHKESIETIEPLIVKLKKEWYEFLTVSELLQRWQKEDFSKKVCYGEFNCR